MQYDFTIEAKNAYGYSVHSQTLTLLVAYIPAPPIDIETLMDVERVYIKWTLVSDSGSPITEYKVHLRHHSSETEYSHENVDCVGTD